MHKKCLKVIFKTQGKARTAAKGMIEKTGVPFNIFFCQNCAGWHIGRANKEKIIVQKKKILADNAAVIGIDPGKKGAMAVIYGSILEIHDFADTLTANKTIVLLNRKFSIKFAILEKVWIRASERDVKSAEILIRNAQMWETLLTLSGIDFWKYAPETWRKGLVPLSGSKDYVIQKAIELFPKYEKEFYRHDRAEAALIAYRAYRHVQAGKPTKPQLQQEGA